METSQLIQLKVRLFGTFEVRRNDEPIPTKAWSRRVNQSLFKFLASQRGVQFSQDQLIEALFPDVDPDKAARNLRARISEVRKLLEPELKRGNQSQFILRPAPGAYCFSDSAACWIDSEAFVSLLDTALALHETQRWAQALKQFEQALALVRDEFLPDDLYEDWATASRERLHERHLLALEGLADCHTQLGQYPRAIELYQQVIQRAQGREHAYRRLMRVQAYAGEARQASLTYQACVEALKDRLGVEPAAETRRLYLQIKKGQLSEPAKPIPHNLTYPATRFIGREEELQAIHQRLDEEDCRLLTLVGPGGIGKTRLSLQAALARLEQHEDGVFFVDLAPLTSAEFLATAVADALRFTFYGQEDPKEQLLNYLQDKKLLLLLDNFEHLLEGVEWLAELLGRAPSVKLLATSRERLKLHGENLYQVKGLKSPTSSQLEHAKHAEVIQFFVDCVRRTDPDFRLTQRTVEPMMRICHLVEGMPLGVELAAALVRLMSLEEVLAEIEANLNILASDRRDVPRRHQSIQAVFEFSWALMTREEREVFMALSVFRGGFTRDAANQVAGASMPLLAYLMDKSLLRRRGSGRYEAHELLRQYGVMKLEASKETETVCQRHLHCFLELAEDAESGQTGPEQPRWLEALEAEHDNCRIALQRSFERPSTGSGLRLAAALGWFWNAHSHYKEGLNWLKQALSQGDGAPEAVRAKALLWAGTLAFYQGDYGQAKAYFEDVLARYRATGNPRGSAHALNGLGMVLHYQGDYAAARGFHEQSLAIRQDTGNKQEIAESLSNLGTVLHYQGDYAGARRAHEQSLAIRQDIEDKRGTAMSLGNLGNVVFDQGDLDGAIAFYKACLDSSGEIGDRRSVGNCLGNLGELDYERGNFAQAQTFLEDKLKIDQEIGNRQGIASSLSRLGKVACAQGQLETARRFHEQSLAVAQDIGDKRSLVMSLGALAELVHKEGGPERASQLLGAYQTLFQAMGSVLNAKEQSTLEQHTSMLRDELGTEAFEKSFSAGHALTLEEAVALGA